MIYSILACSWFTGHQVKRIDATRFWTKQLPKSAAEAVLKDEADKEDAKAQTNLRDPG